MSPFLVLPRALTKPLRWPADSARRARHNAFAANAALAARRAEREEVDQFLAEHTLTRPRAPYKTVGDTPGRPPFGPGPHEPLTKR